MPGVPANAQLAGGRRAVKCGENVATKEHKKQARGLIEGLETRVHLGPPVRDAEILSAREFLRQCDFSPASDYYSRLGQIQTRLQARSQEPLLPRVKRDYGGESGGQYMQVQSIYDHLILSTCYEGEFNHKSGRVKLSHRFNQAGRIDFVELKFLRALEPCLNGELRKVLTVKNYQTLSKSWHAAEAHVLPILPRELIFLYPDIFRCPRSEVLAWLVNVGHRIVESLADNLRSGTVNGSHWPMKQNRDQLCLQAVRSDEIAWPILQKAAGFQTAVELRDTKTVVVRYISK
jgi:hypothetical protein